LLKNVCRKKVIAVINAIQSGEFHSPHKKIQTEQCDENGPGRKILPARPAGAGKRPEHAGEVYFIQVEGFRRPTGLLLACDPPTLPDRVRKKINHYAREFLRRLGRRP
jgi:hypothetical protein